MTGHHQVKAFTMSLGTRSLTLPPGWKPFSTMPMTRSGTISGYVIFARKWHRHPE